MGYIMKRLVNLLKINGVKVTVITEGIIAVMIAVYIRFKLVYGAWKACMYDVYIMTERYVILIGILPIVMFYILYTEKHNLNCINVLLEGSRIRVWRKCVKDMVILCLFFSISVFLFTAFSGRILTRCIYNWCDWNSFSVRCTGKIWYEQPSYIKTAAAFYIEMLAMFLSMGMIMLGVWWFTDRQWAGFMAVEMLLVIEHYTKGYIYNRYMLNYSAYVQGVRTVQNIIMPVISTAVVYLLVSLMAHFKKKEFLNT